MAGRLSIRADFLNRLQRSLDGEAASDRHYFAMRAHDLYESARDLVRLTEVLEHWLFPCDWQLIHLDPDRSIKGYCELPRNHEGRDHDNPSPTAP